MTRADPHSARRSANRGQIRVARTSATTPLTTAHDADKGNNLAP